MFIFTTTGTLESKWEEPGEPGGNPRCHMENLQPPPRPPGLGPGSVHRSSLVSWVSVLESRSLVLTATLAAHLILWNSVTSPPSGGKVQLTESMKSCSQTDRSETPGGRDPRHWDVPLKLNTFSSGFDWTQKGEKRRRGGEEEEKRSLSSSWQQHLYWLKPSVLCCAAAP